MDSRQILILVLVSLFRHIQLIGGQTCTSANAIGEQNPDSKKKETDPETGVSILLKHSDYMIDCDCGVIDTWTYYAKDNAGNVFLQVWRDTGTTWTLVGQNEVTITASQLNSEIVYNVDPFDKIVVKRNDYLGFYMPGSGVITYDNGQDYLKSTSVGALNVGGTHDWNSETGGDKRDYGLNVFVTAGNAPQFDNIGTVATPSVVTIPDTLTVASAVHTIQVSDPDTSESLSLVTSMTSTSINFAFNQSTLEITIKVRPSSGTYTLTFEVKDTCGQTTTGSVRIVVANSAPVIQSLPAYSYIAMDDVSSDVLLHTINVTDASPSDTITCSLLSSNPVSFNFRVSIIPGSTGFGIYSVSGATYTYQSIKAYKVTIQCSDSIDTDSNFLRLFVTANSAPVFTNLSNRTSVSRASTGNNALVFIVSASDVEGDALSMTMSCDVTCPFALNGLFEVRTTSSLIGTTTTGYDVMMTVTDGISTSEPRYLTVLITDINSPPVIANLPTTYPVSVMENVAIGTTIFTVTTKDPDLSQTLSYTASFNPATGANLFQINALSGVLTTKSTIDYELLSPSLSYTLTITVDDGQDTDTNTLQIDIQNENEAPYFQPYVSTYYLIGNEASRGTSLGIPSFVASDPDGDNLTYSLDCPQFYMNPTTKEVSLSINYDLDTTGTPSSVACLAFVSDGELSGTTTLSISFNQLNDNSPKFGLSTYVLTSSAYASVNDVIGNIAATDGDIGFYGTIIYSLDQSSLPQPYFGVQVNGDIYISLDVASYLGSGVVVSFKGVVQDPGGLNDTCDIIVVIQDTTTAPSTTTTERYRTFLEQPENAGWLTAFIICSVLLACLLIYSIYKHNFCLPVKRFCCPRNKRSTVKFKVVNTNSSQKQRQVKMRAYANGYSVK